MILAVGNLTLVAPLRNLGYQNLSSPSLMVRILGFGKIRLRSIFPCMEYLLMCGLPLVPLTLEEMIADGCKHMRLNT
jgi:hypothetical protein